MSYQPPYTITHKILQQVAESVELLTRWQISSQASLTPQLRRNNRIRTILARSIGVTERSIERNRPC
jgi:hypothetical protein